MKLKRILPINFLVAFSLFSTNIANAQDTLNSMLVKADLKNPKVNDNYWKNAKTFVASLNAQPMANPKPEKTETTSINVQSVHNGSNIAFRLTWNDPDKSEAGEIGKFSDGVAIQFPVKLDKDGQAPSAFMGQAGNPVHIFHWKAVFQNDKDNKRMKTIKDIYPNMSADLNNPVEPKPETREFMKGVPENYPKATEEQKNVFSHGKAAGNPQSFPKLNALDEIFAEGWGTSQVINNHEGMADAKWENGKWIVVISRPLKSKVGSVLQVGKNSFIAFAVWQGGKKETGSRKSVTLSWIPLNVSSK